MHSFTAPGTGSPPVPAAGSDAQSVAALHNMLAIMANFSQGKKIIAPPSATLSAPPTVQTQPQPAAPVPVAQAPAPGGFLVHGPWLVGLLFQVVPTSPLLAIVETEEQAQEERFWYCITRGRYVGVTLSNALAIGAVSGVSRSSMKSYKSQQAALESFNDALRYNMVTVLPAQ
ncbi:hypothetical protein B0H15DRAFT_951684 [Mycena belliarum]|uniref:Uncharacterized protein n=1 Tax=Mycena belliarum TaxID=1033014 RepID=A0AAD6TZM7_9AGAR|nr:hypothetical protein B0H15DRAFT_951684 [Mycena belliae]